MPFPWSEIFKAVGIGTLITGTLRWVGDWIQKERDNLLALEREKQRVEI